MAGKNSPTRQRKDRRSEDAGYARGDQTRELIIKGALPVFTARGFEGASIRALAEPSGSRHAAIQYYFGGKEGLFRACTEYLCDEVLHTIERAAAPLEAIRLQEGRNALIEGMITFATRMLWADEASPRLDTALFLAREQSSPSSPAFDIICQRLHRPLIERFTQVVGVIIDRPAQAEETLIRTSSVIASILGTRSQVPVTLSLLSWETISQDRRILWDKVVRTHLRSVLNGRIEEEGSGDADLGLVRSFG
ncbi:CerR family C-terminal domain-containing protein [Novosphingobium sp. BL-52-GroH]|uniref:CerR family C-terminal domain-containing protein n=1 Tax=Novosphingobium sp. BL-52-GroH TaxID=3349877 RepID=UPI00384CE4ED